MEANQNIAGVMGNINMINYIMHQRRYIYLKFINFKFIDLPYLNLFNQNRCNKNNTKRKKK